MEITQSEFDEWRQHPVTREVFKILGERQATLARGLGLGAAEDFGGYKEASGRYQEIQDLLDMAYEDMKPAKEE